ncbi:MAG TPA: putative collagen-binding domain-containing protein, partial [Woeseiaceae bacterium]|nr:putative collagen-binding domain-containing protein [Woeseiaceae bacterium]
IIWDMDEEMDRWRYFTTQDMRDIADYIRALDPYDHPIQYVQWKAELMDDNSTYGRLLGFGNFDSIAMQHDPESAHSETIKWLDKSAAAGHPWLVNLIEMNSPVPVDDEDYWHDEQRKFGMWGNYMAGGSGMAFFFWGAHNDLNLEDYRTRDHLFELQSIAHTFVTRYLPFTEMRHYDELTPRDDDFVFAKPGEVYAVYLPDGGTTTLDLTDASGAFEIKWYDPRFGGELGDGTVRRVAGGGPAALGGPPSEPSRDWTVLVRRAGARPSADASAND